ncbi:hypothetical protein O9993_07095 [Vibrio lentus]|nr:hypothetical protein [Vibrio lentus]
MKAPLPLYRIIYLEVSESLKSRIGISINVVAPVRSSSNSSSVFTTLNAGGSLPETTQAINPPCSHQFRCISLCSQITCPCYLRTVANYRL